MLDPVTSPRLLDEADHPLDRLDRLVLEPEAEAEVEHRLGVRRPFDAVEVLVGDDALKLALDDVEVPDEAVVHPEPAAVPERVGIRLLDRRAGRGTNVCEEER